MRFEELESGQVLAIKEVVTSTQTATIKEHYDMKYHTKLTASKPTIKANGIDEVIVTAQVFNYLEKPQEDMNIDIIFVLDDEQVTVKAEKGLASISFNTEVTGEYIIKTNNDKFRNGEVKVVAE